MPYLFLSYAKADRDTAFVMREVLRKEGFLVWMDENENEPQNQQWKLLESTIYYASAFVVLMSDEAKKSKWVQRELNFAKKNQKLILPILIQGEAWEGFAEKALPLALGLRLDIPDERIAEIKNQLKNYPDSALPPLLPDAKLEAQKQRNFLITVGLIAFLFISVTRLAIYFQTIEIEQNQTATSSVFTQEILQVTESYLQDAATETVEAELALNATASHVALWDGFGTELAYSQGTIAPELLTATQLVLTERAITSEAFFIERTHVYGTAIQRTAISGNGILPCGASIRAVDRSFSIRIYFLPNVDSQSWLRDETLFTGTRMTATEWIINDEGVWYRIATNSQQNYGYVRAEDLILDEDCPR
jgi:hypothetical protein